MQRTYGILTFSIILLLLFPISGMQMELGSDSDNVSAGTEPASKIKPNQDNVRTDNSAEQETASKPSSRAITPGTLVWPMFGKDKYHTFTAASTPKGIYTPAEKWTHDSQIDSLGAAVGDFSSNIFGTYDRDTDFVVYSDGDYLYLCDGGTGESAWVLNIDDIDGTQDNDRVLTAPALAYLNNNDKMDIIFAVDDPSNSSHVYAFEPVIKYNTSGNYNWESDNYKTEILWDYPCAYDMSYSSPVISDIDGDGYLDVVVGGSDSTSRVFAISGKDGTDLSGWPYPLAGTRTSTPAIYEFGTNTRVVITSIELGTYHVYVISDKGKTLHETSMSVPIALAYSLVPSPAIGQLNTSTSNDEIVVLVPLQTSTGRIYCLSHNLTTLWFSTYISGQFEGSPALADIDQDENGDLDVVVGSWDSSGANMYAIEGRTGEILWEQSKNVGLSVQHIIASPALVDIDIDGNIDAVFATRDELFALNGTNGRYQWNFTLPTITARRSSPALGDIDNDKFLDIFIDGKLISHYIIDLTLSEDDVQFSSELIQGQEITISATIHNDGQAEAQEVTVSFLENGNVIGNSTIDTIPGDDTRGANVQWTPEKAGDVTLTIKIDPENDIEEIVENNNDLIMKLNIKAAFADLTFDTLKFYRGDGKEVDNNNTHLIAGEDSNIAAVVRNIGGLYAENVLVRFREGGVNLGVDQLIGWLAVNDAEEVALNWTPGSDYYSIDALVDPVNGIQESNESNNNIIEPKLYVKSNNPGDASYMLTGTVYLPDGLTPAGSAQFVITNERTQNYFSGTADNEGKYSRDLKSLQGGYLEGDPVSIFYTDGSNESLLQFKAYSEDLGRDDIITLTSLPRYSVSLSADNDTLDIEPGSEGYFYLEVKNRGNTNNTINLEHTEVFDVNTGEPAVNWSVNLNAYSVDDLPAGESIERKLTLRPPSKISEAKAGQVVYVTVKATSEEDPTQTDELTVYATLTRKYSIMLNVFTPHIKLDPANSTIALFTLNLTNYGNGPDQVSITTSDVTLDYVSIDFESPVSIEQGGSLDTQLRLYVTANHAPGLFSLTVHATSEDGSSAQFKQLTVQIVRPDLSISKSDIAIPSKLPGVGKSVTVTVTIHNNGTAPARLVEVMLTEEGDVVRLDSVDYIAENSVKDVFLSFVLDKSGKYNFKLVIDPNNVIIESDESNNEVSFSFALYPDLKFIGDITMDPTGPREGTMVTFTATIQNAGDVNIASKFYVEFYYYKSGKRTSIDNVEVKKTLAQGSTHEVFIEWNARQGVATVFCMVDSSRLINEGENEGNNEIMINFSVGQKIADEEQLEGQGSNLVYLGGIIFVVIVILIMYMMFIPPKSDEDEEEEDKSEGKDKKKEAKDDRREAKEKPKERPSEDSEGKSSPESGRGKDLKSKDTEGEDTEDERETTVMSGIVGGIKGLGSFGRGKKRKVKKVKRRKRAEEKETKGRGVEVKSAEKLKLEGRSASMEKLQKAENLLKARELKEKESQLERRSEVLTRKERELKTMKDDLVEIGILEADVIDELEKEEIVEAEEVEENEGVVEVEPID